MLSNVFYLGIHYLETGYQGSRLENSDRLSLYNYGSFPFHISIALCGVSFHNYKLRIFLMTFVVTVGCNMTSDKISYALRAWKVS